MNTPRTIRYVQCPDGHDDCVIVAVRAGDYAQVEAVECGYTLTEAQCKEIEARVLEAEPEALQDDYVGYLERSRDV